MLKNYIDNLNINYLPEKSITSPKYKLDSNFRRHL